MLYARRFFPFYVYNILGGIEEDGAATFLPAPPSLHTPAPPGPVFFIHTHRTAPPVIAENVARS